MPNMLKDKHCTQQITRPIISKNGELAFISIAHYYHHQAWSGWHTMTLHYWYHTTERQDMLMSGLALLNCLPQTVRAPFLSPTDSFLSILRLVFLFRWAYESLWESHQENFDCEVHCTYINVLTYLFIYLSYRSKTVLIVSSIAHI